MILGEQKIVAALGRWNAPDVAFVEALNLKPGPDGSGTLELVVLLDKRGPGVWPSATGPSHRARLVFRGVYGLKLKEFGGASTQVTGFDVYDISDRGWENAKLKVEDYENDRISFLCREAEILEVAEF